MKKGLLFLLLLTLLLSSCYYQAEDATLYVVGDNFELSVDSLSLQSNQPLHNLPIDTLRQHVDQALRHRHPVCWESRKHAMEIVGLAHDAKQQVYYIMKNSWGLDQPHEGLVYMPVDQMWSDMIAVYMTQEAFAIYSASK